MLADLVEEDRAAVGRLEAARPCAATAPVNAPRSWPNSSLSSSVSGRARAVERHERPSARGDSRWISLGEHLLADAGLAQDQHADVRCGAPAWRGGGAAPSRRARALWLGGRRSCRRRRRAAAARCRAPAARRRCVRRAGTRRPACWRASIPHAEARRPAARPAAPPRRLGLEEKEPRSRRARKQRTGAAAGSCAPGWNTRVHGADPVQPDARHRERVPLRRPAHTRRSADARRRCETRCAAARPPANRRDHQHRASDCDRVAGDEGRQPPGRITRFRSASRRRSETSMPNESAPSLGLTCRRACSCEASGSSIRIAHFDELPTCGSSCRQTYAGKRVRRHHEHVRARRIVGAEWVVLLHQGGLRDHVAALAPAANERERPVSATMGIRGGAGRRPRNARPPQSPRYTNDGLLLGPTFCFVFQIVFLRDDEADATPAAASQDISLLRRVAVGD